MDIQIASPLGDTLHVFAVFVPLWISLHFLLHLFFPLCVLLLCPTIFHTSCLVSKQRAPVLDLGKQETLTVSGAF